MFTVRTPHPPSCRCSSDHQKVIVTALSLGVAHLLTCSTGIPPATSPAIPILQVDGEEQAVEPKDVTQFEPSHAQDLPNMVHMHNLHEAPMLYLLQRRLRNGAYSSAYDDLPQ